MEWRDGALSILVTKHASVWLVTIDRPAVKNAVDRATAQALADAFRAFEADGSARVAVLAGEGGSFCAGADLKAIAQGAGNRTEPDGDGAMGPTRMMLSKPTIAAIDGHAVGGGMELALWCDMRVMEEDAVMGFLNRRWGVPLIDGGSVRLPRLVGLSRALDLILTGREMRAEEAHRIGLVSHVVPHGRARAAALSLAATLAALPQAALRGDRASAYEGLAMSPGDALANEFRHGATALERETREGAQRFRDRV
jgi:enoyl-CoA hydratase